MTLGMRNVIQQRQQAAGNFPYMSKMLLSDLVTEHLATVPEHLDIYISNSLINQRVVYYLYEDVIFTLTMCY
jgi:hypothetical protein